ncbi:MAG TPA: bifunctional hydroxymethylpyrimidine kinase/phosphomethylpyrimidine kinase, partial [Thermoanaerobaculia bacterium]|nr:bifunctional hydroxymethylpyrimidine kinase/phosphomethylpyrimidine kinase [Thermoanaerobaculia bacterium]
AVLIKGGHGRGAVLQDLLFDGKRFREFEHPRIGAAAVHGTGCALSAAIAANLALGLSLDEAVGSAIDWVQAAIREPIFPGRGRAVPNRFVPVAGSPTPSTETRTRERRTRSRKRR